MLQNSAFRCSPRHFYADIVGARERKNKRIRHISLSSTGGLLGLHFRKTWKKGMFNIVLHRCFSQHCLFYIYVFRSCSCCSFESYSLSSFIQDSSCFTFQRIIFCSFFTSSSARCFLWITRLIFRHANLDLTQTILQWNHAHLICIEWVWQCLAKMRKVLQKTLPG